MGLKPLWLLLLCKCFKDSHGFLTLCYVGPEEIHLSMGIISCYWCKTEHFPFFYIFSLCYFSSWIHRWRLWISEGKAQWKNFLPVQSHFYSPLYLNSWTNSVYEAHTEHCGERASVCHLRMRSVLWWRHRNVVQRTNRTDWEPEVQLQERWSLPLYDHPQCDPRWWR